MADINVWLALSYGSHPHSRLAWAWFETLDSDSAAFCRFTQIALLRLLNTKEVMGVDLHTVRSAWAVYDTWMKDERVCFVAEPPGVEVHLRHNTAHLASSSAPKALVDCYLLTLSQALGLQLVTLDAGLHRLARKQGGRSLLLG